MTPSGQVPRSPVSSLISYTMKSLVMSMGQEWGKMNLVALFSLLLSFYFFLPLLQWQVGGPANAQCGHHSFSCPRTPSLC